MGKTMLQLICDKLKLILRCSLGINTYMFNGNFNGLTVLNFWQLFSFVHCLPSVLRHCWLGVMDSIQPVKIEWWGVGVVICLEWDADCLHMVQMMPLHPKAPASLASFKSRLVLPFWYRLTQVVLVKRLLNGCSSSCCLLTVCFCIWLVDLD